MQPPSGPLVLASLARLHAAPWWRFALAPDIISVNLHLNKDIELGGKDEKS